MKTTKADLELICLAKQKLSSVKDYDNSPYLNHLVALRGESGKVYFGLNLSHWYGPCAEPVAISSCVVEKDRPNTMVCVNFNPENNKISFAIPCGNCVQLMLRHCPNIKIILDENNKDNVSNFLKYKYEI